MTSHKASVSVRIDGSVDLEAMTSETSRMDSIVYRF